MSATSVMDLHMQDCQLGGGWVNLGEPNRWVIRPVDYGGEAIPGSVLLRNNLFDRVNVNLDPDIGPIHWSGWPEYYPNPTIDLQLLATNNTFRGGFLAMQPVDASAGNWVFENNLFDKVVFAQDAEQPLIHDYNAYWPCAGTYDPETNPDGELWPGQTETLRVKESDPDPVHDKTLAAPLAYEAGPLGRFYLPSSATQLKDAGHGTAAEIGLYHYTSWASQIKEGEEIGNGNVNIGFHYVATAGPTYKLPKDSESPSGDGIPDYIEDADGDGQWDEGVETMIDSANTQTGVADSLNTVYDDLDLSGSGLVGRIKKALGLSAFDTGNPLSLTQTTTGHEPDIVSFKVGRQVEGQFVALDYDLLSSIGGVNLNLDGFDVTLQNSARATSGNGTLLRWNTTYEPPGKHFLQARLTLKGVGARGAVLSGLGTLVPFYSANVCRFFECDALFDASGAYLDAQLPVANATYSIRIYDPSTSPATLLKTIPQKSTSSGMIQEDWDLTCDQAPSPFAGSTFDAVFDVTLLAEDGSTPIAHGEPTKRHSVVVTTPEQGNGFNVAYMNTPLPAGSTLAPEFTSPYGRVWIGMQGVVDILTQPLWPWRAPGRYDSSFNRFTSPVPPSAYPGYLSSQLDVTLRLLPSMCDGTTKNFYCHAHGTANTLETWTGDIKIEAGVVAVLLGNQDQGFPEFPFVKAPSNPYRFVFLDGCSTASDNQWRHAFGIMPYGPPGQAARPVLGPQAFVGWLGEESDWFGGLYNKDGSLADADKSRALQSAYAATLQIFFSEWMNGEPLYACIKHACDMRNLPPCPLADSRVKEFSIKPPYASSSFTVTNAYPSHIRIWGHPGLTRGGLDSEYDTIVELDADGNRR